MILHTSLITRAAVTAAGMVLVVAGCGSDDNPDGESSSSRNDSSDIHDSATLECDDTIAQDEPPEKPLTAVDDLVGLPAADTFGAVDANENPGKHGPKTRIYAKQPLRVHTDKSFDLIVPPKERENLAIAFGNAPETYTHKLHVSCKGSSAQWISFAGGYYAPEKTCASLIVRTSDDEKKVPIGVGKTCDDD